MSGFFNRAERLEDRDSINVFIVSPNAALCQELEDKLTNPRWSTHRTGSGAGALELLRRQGSESGVLLLDPALPDLEADSFRAMVRSRFPQVQILTLNAHTGQVLIGSASPTPVSAALSSVINTGARVQESVPRLVPSDRTVAVHERAAARMRGMIGDSDAMRRTYALARMVAARTTTVLITGESGTGKDLLTQEIHLISSRRNQPLVVVNCSAIPETLLEAELFGYTKGAFTGAVQSRMGRIHAAQGGTLFLDEIGDMPLSLQSKILRFLEQGEVQRIGGNENLKVDVRVIAATNANVKKMIANQQFREDLYYRLAVFPIHLPPLRERMEDLDELAEAFVVRFLPGAILSPDAMEMLRHHSWPGNVRELRNVIERATILVDAGREIKAEHVIF
jgi:transcriptional regulator with GAF, ATPase, and Fis domain